MATMVTIATMVTNVIMDIRELNLLIKYEIIEQVEDNIMRDLHLVLYGIGCLELETMGILDLNFEEFN